MHVRSVGATGLKVSRLGLGTMTWGRDTDEHEARDQLIAFAEAGGSLVDTAAGYGDGASEELVGSLIGDVVSRDEIVIATKAGISRRTGTRVTDASRGNLLSSLDGSLKRLGVDHVDLWQVHTWVDDTPLEETLSALDTAVATGRATYVGVSNYAGWQTAQAATWQRAVPGRAPLVSTQMEYSLLNRAIEDEVLPAARALGLGRAALVAARPRRADGQVPLGDAGRLTRGHLALLRLRQHLPRPALTADRGGCRPRGGGAGLDPARGRPRLGPGPAGGDRPDRGSPHGPAAARGARGRGAHAARRDHHRPRRRLGTGPLGGRGGRVT